MYANTELLPCPDMPFLLQGMMNFEVQFGSSRFSAVAFRCFEEVRNFAGTMSRYACGRGILE